MWASVLLLSIGYLMGVSQYVLSLCYHCANNWPCLNMCTCVYLCSRGPMICHRSETKYCYSWSLLSSTRCIMRCFTSSIRRWCLWWPPLCFGALFFIYLFINSVAIRFHVVKWHRRGKWTGTFVCLHWLSPRTPLPSIFLSNSKQ